MLLQLGLVANLAIAQQFTFGLLKDKRDQFTFIPYTPAQRVQVAQTMDNLFSIYVNRENKISYYAKENPDIDAIPKVRKVLDNAAQMTDRDLHYTLTNIVLSQRDGHLNYNMAAPHNCQLTVKAPRFTVVEEGGVFGVGKKEKIVLNRFIRFPEVAPLTPDAAKMNIGDELLEVDGVPIQQFIKSKLTTWGGANEAGGLRGVLYRLSISDGTYHPMPEEEQTVYKMRSINTGEEYTVTIPWVVRTDNVCKDEAKQLIKQIESGAAPPASFVERKPRKIKHAVDMSNPFVKVDQEAFGRVEEFAKVTVNPTPDPIIRWAIYDQEKKNLGIIYMSSFVPLGSDAARVTLLIRDLLLNQLKDTNAVIFDIRENGGGIGTMADMIPQLVGAQPPTTGKIRALLSPVNNQLILNSTFSSSNDGFIRNYRESKPEQKYSTPSTFTEPEVTGSIGQVYLKPVGVFNNGNCYSACDLFSATMQDNSLATIYGEDKFTGAGGANVVGIDNFLAAARPDLFPPPPFTEQLPNAKQDARVSWRQLVRVQKNEGKLIEDFGIAAEKVFRPVTADFQPNTSSNSQYDRIADDLNRIALASGKKFLYFATTPALISDGQIGTAASFEFDIQGFSQIVITDENGVQRGELKVGKSDLLKRQQRQIRFDPSIKEPTIVKYNIKGFDGLGRLQMNTFRSLRFLPNTSDYLRVSQGSSNTVPFGQAKYAAQFDAKNIREGKLGWNVVNNSLVVGDGVQYKDNVDTMVGFFVNSEVDTFKVTVKATYQTEENYDYLRIGYVKGNQVVQFLNSVNSENGQPAEGVSGKGTIDQTFEVKATGAVELFVRFVSDGAATELGATIESITISA